MTTRKWKLIIEKSLLLVKTKATLFSNIASNELNARNGNGWKQQSQTEKSINFNKLFILPRNTSKLRMNIVDMCERSVKVLLIDNNNMCPRFIILNWK